MSNAEIHKGFRRLLGVDFQGYDGSPDVTTPMTVNVTPDVLVITPGPSNREVYVSIPPAATVSAADVLVDLSCQAPGPGGVPPAMKFVRYHIDSVIPVDLRGATSRSIGPEEPQP